MGLGVEVGEDARGRDAVLQREAGAGGRLGAVAEHPPGAVGAAADLEGDEVQVVAAARGDADQRAQPLAAAGDQAGGQVAVGDEAVRAVEVGDHAPRAGRRAGSRPRAMRAASSSSIEHRDVRERPGALARAGGAVLAEEDAGVAQVLVAAGEAAVELVGAEPGEVVDERPPDRADAALRVEQLVGDARRRPVVGEQARRRIVAVDAPAPPCSDPGRPAQVEGHRELARRASRRAARSRRRCGRAARSGRGGGPRPRCR